MAETDYWTNPDVMARLDAEMSAAPALDGLAEKGDFGSYAVANRGGGLEESGVEHHNLFHVEGRVALYAAALPQRPFGAIADMGCGLGLTTDALRRRLGAETADGYEISSDAVAFASRTFPDSRFHRIGITPGTAFGRNYDLILCQELYAFTRIADQDFQQAMIANFMAHLNPGGMLLIELSERDADRTVLANLPAIEELCVAHGWGFNHAMLPYDRVWRYLPVLPAARMASRLLRGLTRRDANFVLMLSRN